MTKLLKSLVERSVVLLVSSVVALPVMAADTIPSTQTIEEIELRENYAIVTYSPGYTNDLNCGGVTEDTQAVIKWGSSDPNYKVMYSSVLAAYLTGKTIGFRVNDCHSSDLPLVNRFYIVND